MKIGLVAVLSVALMGWAAGASAHPDKYTGVPGLGPERGDSYSSQPPRRQQRAFKEEYNDGNCKVERELKEDGEYKEERKCRQGYRPQRGALEEEYDDGNCKVERELEDGEYKEEIKCRVRRQVYRD